MALRSRNAAMALPCVDHGFAAAGTQPWLCPVSTMDLWQPERSSGFVHTTGVDLRAQAGFEFRSAI
jgi:hypothetical protein